jgi:hypothetical protein
VALRKLNDWPYMDVQCLPAELHNRPEKIPAAVKAKIQANRSEYSNIFVAYGDCGTGGLLDAVLKEEQVERIPGAHCYEFFAGSEVFDGLTEKELGTFYLTDFLLEHFDRLVVRGLGLDRHPSLLATLFGNYRKLVYLAQVPDAERMAAARAAAERLGLTFDHLVTGYGGLEHSLKVVNEGVMVWRS